VCGAGRRGGGRMADIKIVKEEILEVPERKIATQKGKG
jgi:hypothetical protein